MAKKKSGAHLFIDTNILLSFYAFPKDDLEQLEKLVALINAKTIKLYLTQQVVDEFKRNRENNLANSFKEFRAHIIRPCPSFMRDLKEYKAYRSSLKAFKKSNEELSAAAMARAKQSTLEADKLFNKLLSAAKVIEVSEAAFNAARRRSTLGNPPGKQGSIGDELNWELLLSAVSPNTDLHIISKDKNYSSPVDSDQPKAFLVEEWKEKCDGSLFLYEQIGQFFSANFPDQDFSLEIEKQEAISKLIHSGNFATTHSAITLLGPYVSFLTQEQAEEVVQGALSNSQVAWIISDADVEEFFKKMYEEHGESLSGKLRVRLEEALGLDSTVSEVDASRAV